MIIFLNVVGILFVAVIIVGMTLKLMHIFQFIVKLWLVQVCMIIKALIGCCYVLVLHINHHAAILCH